jgi:hypothetical protein
MLSSGWLTDICSLSPNVLEHYVCSIFTGEWVWGVKYFIPTHLWRWNRRSVPKQWHLTLSNPVFLPPAYSPALIYFGRERAWWITCNYPTVLKEKNRNRKSTAFAVYWLKSVLHEEKSREQENHNVGWSPTSWSCSWHFSSCSTDFSQQTAQLVLFLFLFLSFKTVG